MSKLAAAVLVPTLTLCMAIPAYAANSKAPPPPPPKPAALDVTMTVVPLNADIEKTVAQTITLPVPGAAAQKPATAAKPAAQQRDKSGIKNVEKTRAAALRETAEAQREAAEAAKEARKDSHNSSTPDNDTPPLR